jgi:probable rRNA maturation factor
MNDPQLEPDSPADPETAATLWKTGSGNCIEVSYDPVYWPEESLGHFAKISVKLLDHIDREFALDGVLISLLLCGDDRIQHLNSQFRGKDRPTNVLSFPQLDDDLFGDNALAAKNQPNKIFFGEIAIARETVMAQADELGIEINDHLAHLFVHGVIHLLGYDHENDRNATEMEALEVAILAAFSIANPYMIADRAVHHGKMS